MPEKDKSEGYALTWDTLKSDWPLGVLLAGLVGGAVFIHLRLPEEMPLNWALFKLVMILFLYLALLILLTDAADPLS